MTLIMATVQGYRITPSSIHREEKVNYTNITAPATANAAKVVSMVMALLKKITNLWWKTRGENNDKTGGQREHVDVTNKNTYPLGAPKVL
jgi:hypothetical protein